MSSPVHAARPEQVQSKNREPLQISSDVLTELSAQRAIVFIVGDVPDYQSLLAGLEPGAEVHVLDAGQDGLALMAQVLAERSGIDALHIISHGSEGAVSLGSLMLTADALAARAEDLETIRAALTSEADILLYGCSVGEGTTGAAFVEALAKATEADVAASTNLTGAPALGGDWVLEHTSGTIDSYNPFLLSALGSYANTLLHEGTAGGTYDFRGPLTPDTDGDGFMKYGDIFLISDGFFKDDPSSIYYGEFEDASASIEIKAEGGSVAKTFTFQDLTLSILEDYTPGIPFLALHSLRIITKGTDGHVIGTHTTSGLYAPSTTAPFTVSSLMNGNAPFNDTGVASITISWTMDLHPLYGSADYATAAALNFHSITIADVSAGEDSTPPSAPSAPDLDRNSDSGVSGSDDLTSANTLIFSGTSAQGDSSSTVRVFLDSNGNGVFDDGIDASGTAIVNNGSWSVEGIDVSDIGDGTYKVYAQITSASGELTSALSDALDVTLDRTAPSMAITSNASSLKAGQTATITFTFSEDPGATFTWNGTVGDVLVSGGSLSAISGTGLTRTATFTPYSNTQDGSASITVPNGAYTDAAGNVGGAGVTPLLTFDTKAPAVSSIERNGSENSNATSVSYTVTFDQSVSGVDAKDFVLTRTGSVDGTVSSVSGSGSTYTVTVDGISGDGTLRLDLKNAGTGITDTAGNAAAGYTGGQTYTFDTTAPVVSSVAVPSAATYRVDQVLEFTVNFNEVVTVNTENGTPSIALTLDTGGTVQAAYVGGSGSTALTFRYTVVTGNADADGVTLASGISLNGGTITDAVGNASVLGLNNVGATSGVLVAALPPTVVGIERIGGELTNGPSVEYSVTFSDSVTGVDESDFTLDLHGVTGTIASVTGSGNTWIVTIDNISGNGTMRLDLNEGGTGIVDGSNLDIAGGYTSGQSYTIDTTEPLLAEPITISDTALKIGDSATVTFTFTEAVKGFTVHNVIVPNGTLSDLSSTDGGRTWTATLVPSAGTSAFDNVLTLDYTGITDLAGNAGIGTADSEGYDVDTERPSLTSSITISDTVLSIGESATVTFVFTEAVSGFTIDNVTVPNGKLTDLGSTDGGRTWTATLVPSAGTSASANILTLDYTGITDLAGNAGTGTAFSGNYAVDTTVPTLASPIVISDTALKIGDTATVTFVFTEAVTGFTVEDVTVPNGTLSDLSSSDGGRTWTATLVPSAGTSASANVLTLDYTGITDLAGNAGIGTAVSNVYDVDTERPSLASSITISDTVLSIGESATVTFVFTEAVSGFTIENVTVPNGTLTDLDSDDGITWTATLTPSAGSTSLDNVLTLDLSGILDQAGNAGIGSVDSPVYAVDTIRPTLASSISISNTNLKAGDTAVVTFTFNEAVSSFDIADVTVPNGTLSELSSNDDGRVWTATLIPDEEAREASNVLTLDYSGIMDLAGNAGSGTGASLSYAVDTKLPMLAAPITISDTALRIGDTATVTFVFTEAVRDFTAEDVTVSHGSLSDPTSSDGGITWTATLTPAEGASALTNVLSLNYSGIETLSGNVGSGSAVSNTYTVDTVAPTTAVSLDVTSLKAGATATVTFTFSEEPLDFTLADVDAQGGVLNNLSALVEHGNGTWSATATFTPAENQQAESNVITVNTNWTDAAGNAPEAPAVSVNYVVDTVPPVAPGFTSEALSNDTAPVLAGTAEPGSWVEVTVGGATYTVQADTDGWTLDLEMAVPDSGELSLNLNGSNPVVAIATDAAGNESEAGTQTLVIDTAPPSVLITMTDTNLTVRETATVTFTFDEAPHGFTLDDVTAEGGQLDALSDLVENEDGTWSATAVFTPRPNLNDRTNVITVSTEWTDAAGNAPLEAAVSANYVVNTYPPEPVTPPVTPPVIPPVDQWEGLPDSDGDGIPESVENQVPGMIGGMVGDGNGDGIADILQTDVSSLPWAQSPDGTTRFVTLTNGSGLAQTSVKPIEIAPGQVPADLNLPLGLLAFQVDKVPESGSVDFTVYLDSDIAVNGYWKEIDGEWVNIAQSITTEGGKTKISFTIEDGGRFDADGVKNGTIVDPGAPGWRTEIKPDADGDQFPDALEPVHGLKPGIKDNDVFASTKLFVMQLYRDFLYREAEPEGMAYWQARLDSGELTREDVAYTFLFASEFQDNAGAVARLYLGTYDRIADNEGMHYWVDALQEGQSLTQVAEQFAASDEFTGLCGDLDNEGFVSELYLNVQGREAEAEGQAWWVSQLQAGMSRGEVLVRFTQSDEYVANSHDEVAVTLNYVGLLDRTPEQAGFDYWLGQIEAGRTQIEVIGQFIGTDEYHDRFLSEDLQSL